MASNCWRLIVLAVVLFSQMTEYEDITIIVSRFANKQCYRSPEIVSEIVVSIHKGTRCTIGTSTTEKCLCMLMHVSNVNNLKVFVKHISSWPRLLHLCNVVSV